MREFFYCHGTVNIAGCVGLLDYRQGMIDGLELALEACEECNAPSKVKENINYYLRLVKEDKFTKIRMDLGAFK